MKIVLHNDEHIRDVFRQSKIILIRPIIIALAAIILPWYFAWQYSFVNEYRTLFYFWAILVIIYLIRHVVIWRLNEYVITNQRLFRISHDGLFKRTVIETPLERILNVSYKTTGITSVVFGFGDVEVQVVGLVEPLILKNISVPAKIKDYLWQLHSRVATNQGKFETNDIAHIQERVGYTKPDQRIL